MIYIYHLPLQIPPKIAKSTWLLDVIMGIYGLNHHNNMGTWRDIRYPQTRHDDPQRLFE